MMKDELRLNEWALKLTRTNISSDFRIEARKDHGALLESVRLALLHDHIAYAFGYRNSLFPFRNFPIRLPSRP